MSATRVPDPAPAAPAEVGAAPVSCRVLDEAIEWQLRLDSGEAGAAERAAFERWIEADVEHQRAWRQLDAIDARLRPPHAAPERSALLRARPARRQRAGRTLLAVALVTVVGLTVLDAHVPLPVLRLAPDTRLLIQAEHLRDRRITDMGIPAFKGKPADVPRDTHYGTSDAKRDDFSESRVRSARVTLDRRIDTNFALRNRREQHPQRPRCAPQRGAYGAVSVLSRRAKPRPSGRGSSA